MNGSPVPPAAAATGKSVGSPCGVDASEMAAVKSATAAKDVAKITTFRMWFWVLPTRVLDAGGAVFPACCSVHEMPLRRTWLAPPPPVLLPNESFAVPARPEVTALVLAL